MIFEIVIMWWFEFKSIQNIKQEIYAFLLFNLYSSLSVICTNFVCWIFILLVLFIYCHVLRSSEDTRSRAKRLADEIGSFHLNVPIDSIVSAFLSLFETLTGKRPRYKVFVQCNFNLLYYCSAENTCIWIHVYSHFRSILICG